MLGITTDLLGQLAIFLMGLGIGMGLGRVTILVRLKWPPDPPQPPKPPPPRPLKPPEGRPPTTP